MSPINIRGTDNKPKDNNNKCYRQIIFQKHLKTYSGVIPKRDLETNLGT